MLEQTANIIDHGLNVTDHFAGRAVSFQNFGRFGMCVCAGGFVLCVMCYVYGCLPVD